MSAPYVLFLHGNVEEYLADSLLHGLRTVLGANLVDVPRRDALYRDFAPERRARLYGRGFTLYGRLPEVDVHRDRWLLRALEGEFDVVVFGDIWRYWAPWVQLRPSLRRLRRSGVTLAAVDGGDSPAMYPYGPTWWRQMRPWPLPRAHGRILFFKRELSPTTAWARSFGLLPPRLAQRLLLRGVRPISFSIPEDLLARGDEPKTKLVATHVVDPEVAALVPGTATSYAFVSESEYYADLRASRFGITTKKAGWETLRHYELAASGCVPCFRDLERKPERSAPFGLDESNSVSYSSAEELLAKLHAIDDDRYERLRRGALAWAAASTTRRRALEFLGALGWGAGAALSAPRA